MTKIIIMQYATHVYTNAINLAVKTDIISMVLLRFILLAWLWCTELRGGARA